MQTLWWAGGLMVQCVGCVIAGVTPGQAADVLIRNIRLRVPGHSRDPGTAF
jgi:hypothetical protein